MSTFLELQDAVLQACGHSTTESPSTPRTRIKRHLNQWQRRILARPGYTRLLRDSSITLSTVASQAVYGLGIPMGRINGLQNATSQWSLALRDLSWLRASDPGLTASGTPDAYVPRGWFPVKAQPVDASPIYAISTGAGDTTQVIDWEGVTSTLDRVSGSTTLNGTTAAQLGTSSTIVEIVRLSLRTTAAGTVTIREDSGTGTVLLTLAIGQLFGRFFHIQLWPTPSAIATYRLDYTREIQDLVQDTEIPLLPPDFHHVLAKGAEYEEWRKLSDDRAEMTRQDLETELRYLNYWLWDLADASDGESLGHSRLGAWYPAGT